MTDDSVMTLDDDRPAGSHLEMFCLLCGDLTLPGPLSLEAEREDERPLLQELLRCRRLALLRDSSFFLPDVCE